MALALLLDHDSLTLFPFMAPGAAGFGALLGWTTGRVSRRVRIAVALLLGVGCAYANTVLSMVIEHLVGDPLQITAHFGARNLPLGAGAGLAAAAIFSVLLVPAGLVAGAVALAATAGKDRRVRCAA